jgi:hypothetical protein
MRLLLIACEIVLRELCEAILRSPHRVDVQFMPKGLHDLGGPELQKRLQAAIDAADPAEYDAIVFGYGLCGNGLAGLEARKLTLVAPRAHDCITLLLGNRATYRQYFTANPGTYYRSVGWVERGEAIQNQLFGMSLTRTSLESLIEKYGESNGRYLYEEFRSYEQHYTRLAYIENGLAPDASSLDSARAEAAEKHWSFEIVPGELTLFRRLVAGAWDEDFLVVTPGHRIEVSYDGDEIVKAVPIDDDDHGTH